MIDSQWFESYRDKKLRHTAVQGSNMVVVGKHFTCLRIVV